MKSAIPDKMGMSRATDRQRTRTEHSRKLRIDKLSAKNGYKINGFSINSSLVTKACCNSFIKNGKNSRGNNQVVYRIGPVIEGPRIFYLFIIEAISHGMTVKGLK